MKKPSIFIGSSVEGLPIAEHVQLGLDYDAECTLWSQGVFGLSGGTLESLLNAASTFDFAVLVLTPDDLVQKRSTSRNSPRDNVVFELGLFLGALGRDRTYIVYCRDEPIDLPTDLAGVTAATFGKRTDKNLQAALGPVCTQIKAALRKAQAPRPVAPLQVSQASQVPQRSQASQSYGASDAVSAEVVALKASLAAQAESLRQIMAAITSPSHARPSVAEARPRRDDGEHPLKALEGVWKSPESRSLACARVVGGELRWLYAYGGGRELTGEYYNWKLTDGNLFARFRWFNSRVEGYAYLQFASKDELKGGWWYGNEAPDASEEKLPDADRMKPAKWLRQPKGEAAPQWAEEHFKKLAAQVRR